MSDQYEISAKITADDSGFQSAFDRMESGLEEWGISLDKMYEEGASVFKKFGVDIDQFASKLGTTGPMLAAGVGVAAVAVKELGKVIDETTKEFAEDETAQLKFNAAMKASSSITDEDAEALSELAEKTGLLTGNTTASVQSQIAMLAATGRSKDEIEKMMTAAEGLSNATGVDLNTALTQINATFSGTSGRLSKMTPELSSLTSEQLKHGDAVDILNKKYGEFATTLSGSTAVSIANQKNQIGELKSVLGEFFESGLKPLRDAITQVIEYLVSHKEIIIGVIEGIGAAVALIIGYFNPILGGIALVVTAIFSLQNAVGGWKMLWLETEKVALEVVKAILDATSTLANGTIEMINGILTAYNKVVSVVGGKPIKLLSEVDISTATGVTNALKDIDTQIDKTRETNEKRSKENKTTSDNIISGTNGQAKAEEEYKKSIESTNEAFKSGVTTQKDALKENIATTEKYIKSLGDQGQAGTSAYSNALASLNGYKAELTKLENTEENQKTRQADIAKAADDAAKQIAQDAANNAANMDAAAKQAHDNWLKYMDKLKEDGENTFSSAVDKWLKPFSEMDKTIKTMFGKDLMKTISSFAQNAQKILSSVFSYLQSGIDAALKKTTDAISKNLASQEAALDANLQSQLEAIGETEAQKLQANIDSLKLQIAAETDADKKKTLEAELAEAEKAQKKYNIEQDYQKKKEELEKDAETKKKKAEYDAAMQSYNLKMAQAISSAALAVIEAFAQLGPVAGAISAVIIGATTALQIATIQNNKPTLAAATGSDYTAAGYYRVGEVGPETMYVPQGAKIYNAAETASGISRTSNNNVVVNITSPKALNVGEANRLFKQTQRQLVFSGAYA